jgi:hypothetical protein
LDISGVHVFNFVVPRGYGCIPVWSAKGVGGRPANVQILTHPETSYHGESRGMFE